MGANNVKTFKNDDKLKSIFLSQQLFILISIMVIEKLVCLVYSTVFSPSRHFNFSITLLKKIQIVAN